MRLQLSRILRREISEGRVEQLKMFGYRVRRLGNSRQLDGVWRARRSVSKRSWSLYGGVACTLASS